MGNRASKRQTAGAADGAGVVLRSSKRRLQRAVDPQREHRPVSSVNGSRLPGGHQLRPRPTSMQSSVPSSTMHSDARLVIGQLCAKRPKYSLLKQIDLDQLDDQVQFLLFESVCDLLDQLGTIERLKAEQRAAAGAAVSGGDAAVEIVSIYRRLASRFLTDVVPELLLLTGYRTEELYSCVHRVLAALLLRAAELRAEKVAAILADLAGLSRRCGGVGRGLRRQVEQLLGSTAAAVATRWEALLPADGAVIRDLLPPSCCCDPAGVPSCTREFLDACADWSWRAACCDCGAGRLMVRVDQVSAARPLRFDSRLHRTVIGLELAAAEIDCVLWPALCRDGPEAAGVLCKALVRLC